MSKKFKLFLSIVMVITIMFCIYSIVFKRPKKDPITYAFLGEVEIPKVYDNMTLDELSEKLNRSLNSTVSGKGKLIAEHSLEMGVDPYVATAILLHETGCKWNCSYLVKSCNNVGGQVGSGCGGYSYFPTLDDGIIAFIDNLSYNYVRYGLKTPEQMNTKYASDKSWAQKVNNYIEIIKAQ